MKLPRWRLEYLCLLVPVACGLVTTRAIWFSGESYFLRDMFTNYSPIRALQRQVWLSEGHFLRWNPFIGGGLPALAEPNGSFFYPPSWPFLLFEDQAWALSFCLNVHALVAAAGIYCWARRKLSIEGAATAAAALVFGGLMLSNKSTAAHWFMAAAWVPWVFLSIERACASEGPLRVRWFLLLAALWALQLLASEPQVVYLEGFTAGVAALLSKARVKALSGVALASLLALAWAAPQLVPMAAVLPEVDRLGHAENGWAWHPLRAWELVLPLPWGETFPRATFWGGFLGDAQHAGFYFYSLYTGALTIALAALGLRGLTRAQWPWLAGTLVLVLASVGSRLPVNGWLKVLPLWKAFRYEERLWLLPTVGLAWLMGLGVERVRQGVRWPLGAGLLVSAALCLTAAAAPGLLGAGDDVTRDMVRASALEALVVLGAAGLTLFLPPSRRAIGLAIVVALDVAVATRHLEATWRPPTLAAAPVLPGRRLVQLEHLQLATGRMEPSPVARRTFEAALRRPNFGMGQGEPFTNAVTALRVKRGDLVRSALGPLASSALWGTREFISDSRVGGLESFQQVELLPAGLARYTSTRPPVLAEALADVTSVAAPEEGVALLKSGRHSVEASPAAGIAGASSPTSCELSRQSTEDFTVTCPPAPEPRYVRVADNYFPGWQASSSAGPVEVSPLDVAFLGAPLAAGESVLRFHYESPGWTESWLLHLLGWAAAALIFLRRGRLAIS